MSYWLPPLLNLETDDLRAVIQKIDAGFLAPELIEISLPAYALGFAGDYLSICEDLLDVSYCVEGMAAHANGASLSRSRQPEPPHRTHFVLKISSPNANFLGELRRCCIHYGGDNAKIAVEFRDYFENYSELMDAYKVDLTDREFKFPELIDDYLANLVNGAYYAYEETDWVQRDLEIYPERRFGFHRSAFSSRLGSPSYASIESWIVPTAVDPTRVFDVLNINASEENFRDAYLSMIGDFCFATSGDMQVHFPLDTFLKGRVCQSFIRSQEQVMRLGWQRPLFSLNPTMISLSTATPSDASFNGQGRYKCRIHESGEIVFITDEEEKWRHFFFDTCALGVSEAKKIGVLSAELNSQIQRSIGLAETGTLDWRKIDDAQFETLCYDLIYAHPSFDHDTIRKMGQSRSRDGGRDIVVWTKPTAFRETPKKYVFQCKLVSSKKSLGKRDVPDVGDMLEQYAADGFGIMTSVVIDTTLFDAVDEICRRRGIAQKHFSKLEIERFLNQRPSLRKSHFGF